MGNGVRGPPAALTTDLHSFTDDQQRSWCLLSLAEVGEDRFARSILRASDGNPFDVSTPESAVGDLRELVESAVRFPPERRGIHNEGARVLQERLAGKAELDQDTARRLFTLICVLQFGG